MTLPTATYKDSLGAGRGEYVAKEDESLGRTKAGHRIVYGPCTARQFDGKCTDKRVDRLTFTDMVDFTRKTPGANMVVLPQNAKKCLASDPAWGYNKQCISVPESDIKKWYSHIEGTPMIAREGKVSLALPKGTTHVVYGPCTAKQFDGKCNNYRKDRLNYEEMVNFTEKTPGAKYGRPSTKCQEMHRQ